MRGIDDTLNPNEWRATFGVISFSGNTATEADFNRIAPYRITFAAARAVVPMMRFDTDEEFLRSVSMSDSPEAIQLAAEALATAKVRHVIFAVTSTTMWNGMQAAEQLRSDVSAGAGGVGVTLGGHAIVNALRAVGASRVAMITPYRQVVVERMNDFLAESGIEVARVHNVLTHDVHDILRAQSAPGLMRAILDLDGDDVEAIIQSGANMSLLGVAAMAERLIGKPVLPINAMALWSALREEGFDDPIDGFGTLFSDH
jgi:maleate isomerase